VGSKPESIFLVFEYCEIDLAEMVDRMVNKGSFFTLAEIKCIVLQLVRAVIHLHDNSIIHRDLKLSNLLLTNEGVLKMADFGLARQLHTRSKQETLYDKHGKVKSVGGKSYSLQQMTQKVVTLWYRAPEILLRSGEYSKPCDVWAVGCILGELLNKGRPIMPG